MRVVLQRVKKASVAIADQTVGQIDQGLLLLVGFQAGDGSEQIDHLVKKIANCRIFSDEEGKMNLNVQQIAGKILSISQFTLYADTKKGNRPSFTKAQEPDKAAANYVEFNQKLQALGIEVQTGEFGADMQVSLINDGPVTIIFDTENR